MDDKVAFSKFSEYLIVPTVYEQLLEMARLIMQELFTDHPKKLGKRTIRISFGMELPGLLTEEQKSEIRRMLSIVPNSGLSKGLLVQITDTVKNTLVNNAYNMVNIMSCAIALPTDLPIYPSFDTEEKLRQKKDEDAFLTQEMHQTPELFIIGIWINNLVFGDVIKNHQASYNKGEFIIEGKGGCFFGFTLLTRFGIEQKTAEDIYNYCNLGDVDIGIYICNDLENRDELRSSICKNIADVACRIKHAFFKRGTILSDLITMLVPQSIKNAGYRLITRHDIQLLNGKGIKSLFFNEIVAKDLDGYDGTVWFSDNDTLTFKICDELCSFRLQRLCIGFYKDNRIYKSELIDWATPSFKDTGIIEGKFYKALESSVKCHDFTLDEYIDILLQYVPNRLSVERSNLLKLLKTFTF